MVNWLKERRDGAPLVYLSVLCWRQHHNFHLSTVNEYVTGTRHLLFTPDRLSAASLHQRNHILDQFTGNQTGERNVTLWWLCVVVDWQHKDSTPLGKKLTKFKLCPSSNIHTEEKESSNLVELDSIPPVGAGLFPARSIVSQTIKKVKVKDKLHENKSFYII